MHSQPPSRHPSASDALLDPQWRRLLFLEPAWGSSLFFGFVLTYVPQIVYSSDNIFSARSLGTSIAAATLGGALYLYAYFRHKMNRLAQHFQSQQLYIYTPVEPIDVSTKNQFKNPSLISFRCREMSGELEDITLGIPTMYAMLVNRNGTVVVSVNEAQDSLHILHPAQLFLIDDEEARADAQNALAQSRLNAAMNLFANQRRPAPRRLTARDGRVLNPAATKG